MLRHKYTKKRMKNKYNRKKRTKKMRGGGNKSSRKKSKFRQQQKEAGERMNMRAINQSNDEDILTPVERRNLVKFAAMQLQEKCEATKEVNDDGSIECPNKRSKAKKKINKFHPDKNPGCQKYAQEMMVKYNETCYGDDSNVNRKWDKNDKNYRNERAALDGFYPTEASAVATSNDSESKSKVIPSSCKKPASKIICTRYCKAKGVVDPKCDCCPGSDAAKKAVAKEAIAKKNTPLTLMDGSVGPSAKDLITQQKTQKLPVVPEVTMDEKTAPNVTLDPIRKEIPLALPTVPLDEKTPIKDSPTNPPEDSLAKLDQTKNAIPKKNYVNMFFSFHFNKINEIDASIANKTEKVIPWLTKK